MRRSLEESDIKGCMTAVGCLWVIYAAFLISALLAISIILWRVAVG
jgi:hypothetical protein